MKKILIVIILVLILIISGAILLKITKDKENTNKQEIIAMQNTVEEVIAVETEQENIVDEPEVTEENNFEIETETKQETIVANEVESPKTTTKNKETTEQQTTNKVQETKTENKEESSKVTTENKKETETKTETVTQPNTETKQEDKKEFDNTTTGNKALANTTYRKVNTEVVPEIMNILDNEIGQDEELKNYGSKSVKGNKEDAYKNASGFTYMFVKDIEKGKVSGNYTVFESRVRNTVGAFGKYYVYAEDEYVYDSTGSKSYWSQTLVWIYITF